jgi:hypothetical protein
MTLLFIKRLNDTFEENAEKLIKEEGKKLNLTNCTKLHPKKKVVSLEDSILSSMWLCK